MMALPSLYPRVYVPPLSSLLHVLLQNKLNLAEKSFCFAILVLQPGAILTARNKMYSVNVHTWSISNPGYVSARIYGIIRTKNTQKGPL